MIQGRCVSHNHLQLQVVITHNNKKRRMVENDQEFLTQHQQYYSTPLCVIAHCHLLSLICHQRCESKESGIYNGRLCHGGRAATRGTICERVEHPNLRLRYHLAEACVCLRCQTSQIQDWVHVWFRTPPSFSTLDNQISINGRFLGADMLRKYLDCRLSTNPLRKAIQIHPFLNPWC